MAVQDHGLEVLKKSGNEITPGDHSDYYIATKLIDAVEGAFTPSGLTEAFVVKTVDVSTTAVTLPGANLTNRNAISIHNTSGTTTIYLGPNNSVTADNVVGSTSGWEIGPGEFFNLDITDSIDLYAITASGTARVKVMEIA